MKFSTAAIVLALSGACLAMDPTIDIRAQLDKYEKTVWEVMRANSVEFGSSREEDSGELWNRATRVACEAEANFTVLEPFYIIEGEEDESACAMMSELGTVLDLEGRRAVLRLVVNLDRAFIDAFREFLDSLPTMEYSLTVRNTRSRAFRDFVDSWVLLGAVTYDALVKEFEEARRALRMEFPLPDWEETAEAWGDKLKENFRDDGFKVVLTRAAAANSS